LTNIFLFNHPLYCFQGILLTVSLRLYPSTGVIFHGYIFKTSTSNIENICHCVYIYLDTLYNTYTMYICIYIHIHMFMYIHMHIHTYIIHTYITYIHTYIYIYMYIYMYVCIYLIYVHRYFLNQEPLTWSDTLAAFF